MPPPPDTQVIGGHVGPYVVLAQLGSGGMGDVYLAEDTRLGRKVALKKPSDAWLSLPDARKRLHREARAAGGLTHPNIAAVYDVIDVGPHPYIVMEYVDGESLADVVRRGPLPVDKVLELGIQVADALAAAHRKGIVHRDLKPGNVSVTAEGRPKVLDFGLAKARPHASDQSATRSTLTLPGQILGTPGYASPEQMMGAPADPRDDIYSLGVLLFELATGRRPFQADDAMGLALATLTQAAPRATDINPGVPRELSDVLARALARDPDARFSSAAEFGAALQRLADDFAASRTGPVTPPRVFSAITWRRAIGLILVLTALAAAGLLLARRFETQQRKPARVPVLAVLPFANHSDRPGDASIAAGMWDVLIANLGGQPGLNVLSRTAAAEPAPTGRDLKSLAKSLGATFLLDGSLQRQDKDLKISIALVRGDSGIVAWSETYSAPETALFELQERISAGVSGAPPLVEAGAGGGGHARFGTNDVEAFEQYGQAVAFLERPDIAGNPKRAEHLLQSVVKRDAKFALAWARLGEAYWALYQETLEPSYTEQATNAIHEALRLDRDQPRVWISLALIHHGTGRNDVAIEDLNQALKLQPNSDDAHRLLGQVLQETGRHEKAADHFRRAIDLRPNYWRNHSLLGGLHYATGRYQDAIEAFTRVTELQPDNARGFHNLGTIYYTVGDHASALKQYKQAIAIAPMAHSYSGMGAIHYDDGRYEAAVQAFTEAVRMAPNDGMMQGNLGDALARLGRSQEARRAYSDAVRLERQALSVNANDATTLARMAVWEAKLQLRAEAERDVRRALELNATDAEILYRAAEVHALIGNTEDALRWLEQALIRGYSAALAARDDDLASIQHSAQYRKLIARQ